jgi:uncharacterized protein
VSVEVIALDLSQSDAPKALLAKLEALNVEVEFLVNNAGFGTSGAFHELPAERELEMIDLNIRSLVHLTRLILPKMIERNSGRILNVGSTAGFLPGPYMATYYASKAFVNSFTEALSVELKGTNVTASVLAPGPVATEFGKVAGLGAKRFTDATMDAFSVARYGYDAMMSGDVIAVPGLALKAMIMSMRFAPRSAIRQVTGKVIRSLR